MQELVWLRSLGLGSGHRRRTLCDDGRAQTWAIGDLPIFDRQSFGVLGARTGDSMSQFERLLVPG
jgi:hypothetical protein